MMLFHLLRGRLKFFNYFLLYQKRFSTVKSIELIRLLATGNATVIGNNQHLIITYYETLTSINFRNFEYCEKKKI